MGASGEGWHHSLREQPPRWPRRDDGRDGEGQPWLREPEPFEDRGMFEPYPGATVLDDFALSEDDATSLRILARYTTARVLLLSAAGRLAGHKLRTECSVAREHLSLLPPHDWERRVLERLCDACRGMSLAAVVDAAIVAAEAAAKRGHGMGAFGLYRGAYEAARDRGWWVDAARAASGIARLAELAEARRSTRIWQWREGVLQRRAQREADEQAEGDGPDNE
ncbi:MAG TPA: hypothetical protein VK936_08415 [Longimicrobiales bacterium]|nr:hypothetical protein [Longimicrobiales bacterium]